MYTYLGIIRENALHVGSHVGVINLVVQIRFNRIAEEVVSDLARQTGIDGIVIHFILYEIECLLVIKELEFAHKRPHRIRDRKLYHFTTF